MGPEISNDIVMWSPPEAFSKEELIARAEMHNRIILGTVKASKDRALDRAAWTETQEVQTGAVVSPVI